MGSSVWFQGKELLILIYFLLLISVASLKFFPKEKPKLVKIIRYWYPLALLPFFYSSIQYLSRLVNYSYFDSLIVGVEQTIFGFQPSQVLWKFIPDIIFPQFFHFSYIFYSFIIPLIGFILFYNKRYSAFRIYVLGLLTTFISCYLFFIFFPVMGPYHYLGPIAFVNSSLPFLALTYKMLEYGSSIGTAFPSSHSAIIVFIWIFSRRFLKKTSNWILVFTIGILFGAIYGGFHYAIDVLVGAFLGAIIGGVIPKLYRKV
ncbi:phosphatase PAP2 family protein [archaeon]|nr:phosphatase PAP2 family protein [archaeon]